MKQLLELLNLLNATTPGVATLVLMIRGKDGNVTLVGLLDEADQKFGENLQQAKDWLASHPKAS